MNWNFKYGILLLSMLSILSSCFKEELPYEVPEKSKLKEGTHEDQIHQGEFYDTEVYYSFTDGVIKSGAFNIWDLAFSCSNNEIWMNGGKNVLLYQTEFLDFSQITTVKDLDAEGWKYDFSSGLKGESALGILDDTKLNKLVLVNDGSRNFFKFKITNITDQAYEIEAAPLESSEFTKYTLTKNDNYNFVHFSFNDGIVVPEPPKESWDIVFTRYRFIFLGKGDDSSDVPYFVSGVLLNPYKTSALEDTVVQNYNDFTLEHAHALSLMNERDIIGYDWKKVDINTTVYTVNTKVVFVVSDSKDNLWKLGFIDYYDDNGLKGSPRFRFEQLH